MLTILNDTHLELFLDLKKDNPGMWRMNESINDVMDPKLFFKKILLNTQSYTVGWIENKKLLSVASMWEDVDSPTWVFNYYCSRKTNFFNYKNTNSNLVISELFHESLRRKLTSCIMITRTDYQIAGSGSNFVGNTNKQMSLRAKEKIAKMTQSQLPIINQYDWVDEFFVPANTLSKYFTILFFNKTWSFDLVVRRAFLKQEYRKDLVYV
jgi:hypothetical protein